MKIFYTPTYYYKGFIATHALGAQYVGVQRHELP